MLDRRRRGGGRIRISYLPKYSPFDGCLDNVVAVWMLVVLHFILFFFTFCYSTIASQTKRYSFFMNNTGVLSQKLRSDISDISRAQWNGVDPTQAIARLVIVVVSKRQKSGTGDNNFVPGQIFLSDQTEMVRFI